MSEPKISADDFKRYRPLRDRARKGKALARALDAQADALPFAKVLTIFEFEGFIRQLTPKRFELLRLAKQGGCSIADLALAARRDPSSVSKDVGRLSQLGLLKVALVPNAGHGLKKIVTPVATTISIQTASQPD